MPFCSNWWLFFVLEKLYSSSLQKDFDFLGLFSIVHLTKFANLLKILPNFQEHKNWRAKKRKTWLKSFMGF